MEDASRWSDIEDDDSVARWFDIEDAGRWSD